MPRKYYVFANASVFTARLAHDSGWSGNAVPGSDPQGRQGMVFDIPDGVPDNNGAEIGLDSEGKNTISIRGVLATDKNDPSRAYLECDDFKFTDKPAEVIAPPVTPPPGTQKPIDYINAVYATGAYNLATKAGCGQFTEACCLELAKNLGFSWGHVAKSPGQNQYNNHAVDAVMCLSGEYDGIWDIIYSSVSSEAKPVFNRAGDIKPEIWRPATPVPVEPAGAKVVKAVEDSEHPLGAVKGIKEKKSEK